MLDPIIFFPRSESSALASTEVPRHRRTIVQKLRDLVDKFRGSEAPKFQDVEDSIADQDNDVEILVDIDTKIIPPT